MTSEAGHKRDHQSHASSKSNAKPKAKSVDGSPDDRPTPVDPMPHVGPEDEPKGQPNSDRFHSEQAHRPEKGKP
jgi:hypothetical protein